MYYPLIILDNGYVKNVKDAVSEGYCIPGGHFFKINTPLEFTYGYAITCHKAQGSEWDKVLVIEEDFPFSKEEHARWLYTAATRAAEKLVLIKK